MARGTQVELLLAGVKDSSGEPLVNGKVYAYSAGTTTAKDLYSDISLGAVTANPLTLDALGQAHAYGYGIYKLVIASADDAILYTYDNLYYGLEDRAAIWCGVASGTANAIVLSAVPPLTEYVIGQRLSFIPTADNTGATTINVDAQGAKTVVTAAGVALGASAIVASQATDVIYDGTNFILLTATLVPTEVVVIPAGTVCATARATAPDGWSMCNGAAISRTAYADLFAAIGTTFGAGDGSTTFNKPDLRQRFPIGMAASGTGAVLGETGGAVDHVHTGPSHQHSLPAHHHGMGTGATLAIGASGSHAHTNTVNNSLTFGDMLRAIPARLSSDYSNLTTATPGYTALTAITEVKDLTHAHTVTIAANTHSHTAANFSGAIGLVTGGVDGNAAMTAVASGTENTGLNNPPYLALNYMIKT